MPAARETSVSDQAPHAQFVERRDLAARALEMTVSIGLHVLTGILAWQYPPGRSVGSWVLYLVLGIVGLLGIIHAARPRTKGPESAHATVYDKLAPSALPYYAKSCPGCSTSLERVIRSGRRTCSKCGRRFQLRDLGWSGDDPAGEPLTLSPLEKRIDGRSFALAVGLVLFACVLVVLLAFRSAAAPPPIP